MNLMEKFLRSPINSAVAVVLLGYVCATVQYKSTLYPEYLGEWMNRFADWPIVFFCFFFVIWCILTILHNRRHPERKIPFFHYLPLEFREEDEGQQWVTYRACRRVYIFFSCSIPFALLTLMFAPTLPYLPILTLTLIGVGQYILFWWELRKWEGRDR